MDPVITLTISVCMFLLFFVAAAHKLRALADFRSVVEEYRLIPRAVAGIAAMLFATMELLAALLVLIPATRSAGLAAMAGLLFLYTAGIGINLYRGRREIDCGCSGPASGHPLSGWLLLRNLSLAGLVLLAWGPSADRPLNWLDLLVVAFAVLVASGLYLGINRLLAQAPRMARVRSAA